MPEMCPLQYSRRNNPAYPRMLRSMTMCHRFAMILSPQEVSTKSTLPVVVRPTLSVLEQAKALPLEPRTLEYLMGELRGFQVVDLTTRLLFTDPMSYQRVRSASSVPVYVPKVAGVVCSTPQSNSKQLPSVRDILPWCHIVGGRAAVTPYHRSCKRNLIQVCQCTGNNFLVDHVHNSCLGQNTTDYQNYKYPLWDTFVKFGAYTEDQACLLMTVTNLGYTSYKREVEDLFDYKIKMRVLPLLHSYRSQQVGLPMSHDIVDPKQLAQTSNRNIDSETDVNITVEFTNTMEQSFLCSNMQSYLENCRLVRCAGKALLWTEGPNHDSLPARQSCIRPHTAKVSVIGASFVDAPLCTCIHVIAVLKRLGLWKTIKFEGSYNEECIISLVTLSTQTIQFDSTYTFPEVNLSTTAVEKSQVDSTALAKLLVNSTKQFCAEEVHLTFKICFISESAGNTIGAETGFCMTWSEMGYNLMASGAISGYRVFGYIAQMMTVIWYVCWSKR